MKLLLIENDPDFLEDLIASLNEVRGGQYEVSTAESRDEALMQLQSSEFDLVVCDIRIPPPRGHIGDDEQHGLAVASEAQQIAGGTPLIFLTGYATATNTREALSMTGLTDLFGDGLEPLVQMLQKSERTTFLAHVDRFTERLALLEAFDVSFEGDGVVKAGMDTLLRRALAIYGRRRSSTRATASLFRGLSGAVTGRAVFLDNAEHPVGSVFFKVGPRRKMLAEKERYGRYVRGSLQLGAFPPEAGSVVCNIRKSAALFYSVAERYTSSFFDLIRDPSNSEEATNPRLDSGQAVAKVREMLAPWHARRHLETVRLETLRSSRISDQEFAPYRAVLGPVEEYEASEIEMFHAVQHGDMHGENVLFDEATSDGVLIDFGDVGIAPVALDAITLEMSLVFHLDSPVKNGSWPSEAQAEQWWNLEQYLVGCPAPDVVIRCREWATAADARAIGPLVYAHACRQLKYGERAELALAFARGALSYVPSTA